MQRPIKFRAWDTEPGKECFVDCSNHEVYQLGSGMSGLGNRYIYQQSTGLKDKNGVEIYEGDVVRQRYEWNDGDTYLEGYHTGEVIISASKGVCLKNPIVYEENEDYTTIANGLKNVRSYRAEVIGNVYENKELLDAKAN